MRAYQIGEELTIAALVMPARFFAEYTTLTDELVTGILNAQPDFDSGGLVTILNPMAVSSIVMQQVR